MRWGGGGGIRWPTTVTTKANSIAAKANSITAKANCNPSQKSLATLRRKPSPASPLSMLLHWCRLFFRYFFEPAKQHWTGCMGEKEATVQCYCLRLWLRQKQIRSGKSKFVTATANCTLRKCQTADEHRKSFRTKAKLDCHQSKIEQNQLGKSFDRKGKMLTTKAN